MLNIAKLHVQQADFARALDKLLNRSNSAQENADRIEQQVREILAEIKSRGDAALFSYTEKFDGHKVQSSNVLIDDNRLSKALANIPAKQRESLEYAAQRIRQYHRHQLQESWSYVEEDGTRLGQKVSPIERAGLYVPGGKASYPSSVLMNAIPAKVAGVNELIMVTPTPNGELNEMVLAAAKIAGVDKVFCIGGAQAIAALAYGTESVPAVDKITGPGNIYVATAKKQVFGTVGIDMIAGPSEVLIIADSSANPDWVAMDMFAQAEHDEQAQSIVLVESETTAEAIAEAIERLLPSMQRKEIIQKSLASNGAIIVVGTNEALITTANTIAAEHLEIFHQDAELLADQIRHAGAIFIGQYSAESMGDYCAGPNHVLPTAGTARFSSPLGVSDFQKRSSIIQISKQGAQTIGKHAATLAYGESLEAHARSAEYRLDKVSL